MASTDFGILDERFAGIVNLPATLERPYSSCHWPEGPARVARTEQDGSIAVLPDRHSDKRLYSPDDGIAKSNDSTWFSDPTYGIDSDYDRDKAEGEIRASSVYRIHGASGRLEVVEDDFIKPNGLAFSPDESKHPARNPRVGHEWLFRRTEARSPFHLRHDQPLFGSGRRHGCKDLLRLAVTW